MQLHLSAGSPVSQASREPARHLRPLLCSAAAVHGGNGSTGGGANVCVLGAGVIGLSSAVRLAEELDNVQVGFQPRRTDALHAVATKPV